MLLIGYVLVLEISQTVWKAFCQHEDYGKGGNFKEAKSFFPKEKKGAETFVSGPKSSKPGQGTL